MLPYQSFSRLSLLLLSLAVFSLTGCNDDDDTFLGIDFDDDGTLFLSSNTSGTVGVLNLEDGDMPAIETFMAAGTDADGLFYESGEGNLYQVNRSDSTVVEYNDVIDDLDDPNGVDVEARSTSDFTNGRGLAANDQRVVVAQQGVDANDNRNRLIVYDISNDDDVIELSASYPTNIALWGVQFVGDDLYAVVDKSDSVAVYTNFLANTNGDTIMPTRYIKVDGITRTHGLEYNADDDIMILTDIGAADNSTDGALIVIRDFSTLGMADMVATDRYTRIGGDATRLGNPVDVAYDMDTDRIYVAERATGSGVLLIFSGDASDNAAPLRSIPFVGLSSLYLHRD
ncbi:hypothetical protein LEM8419_02556 [Neolewinella maritima]|uniref:Uncharacterized protein n=1 Tax=Neolewinella maritima TaxID=1383882 RepID=A0ABN8F3V8_9BACT|nr:hypothetical protein [Neolewinella maritima]CAH1001651.1 hypothetical protein LEM8419_02556 [Neolewinella maritima]